jgi:hypothetical protein
MKLRERKKKTWKIDFFFLKKEKDRQRNRTLRPTELMLKIWAPRE